MVMVLMIIVTVMVMVIKVSEIMIVVLSMCAPSTDGTRRRVSARGAKGTLTPAATRAKLRSTGENIWGDASLYGGVQQSVKETFHRWGAQAHEWSRGCGQLDAENSP
jgi:hypothetical protein